MKQTYLNTLANTKERHKSPIRILWDLLRLERQDIWVILVYTLCAGLFSLAVPVAAQALVNTIAARVFIQPVVVLSMLVFVGLLCSGAFQLCKVLIIERLQQRVFARITLQVTERLTGLDPLLSQAANVPETLNRFFEMLTLQKIIEKLLMDGPTALLQIVGGLLLIAFYNPVLLGFDIFILLFVGLIGGVLGNQGLHSSLEESHEKYHLLDGLQRLSMPSQILQPQPSDAVMEETEHQLQTYIHARNQHFRVLYRQMFGNAIFQALAGAGILGLGGWLVINQQLTLGQLVASELVVVILITALGKLVGMLPDWYKLLTALSNLNEMDNVLASLALVPDALTSTHSANIRGEEALS